MSDGQVIAKIKSWSRKNITEKLSEHNSSLNAFFESKWVGIGIDLFQCGLLSYPSSLRINFNHSIRMSDDQVMAKIQSWSRKNITEKLSEHNSTLNAFFSPNGSEFG